MKIRACKIEITDLLGDNAREQCGRYWETYIYEADTATYCCELTPSYWLEAVNFETENKISDDLHGDLLDLLYESSHYRHIRNVKRLPNIEVGEFDSFEDALEHCLGNPPYIPGEPYENRA